jgi:hypothetical protein
MSYWFVVYTTYHGDTGKTDVSNCITNLADPMAVQQALSDDANAELTNRGCDYRVWITVVNWLPITKEQFDKYKDHKLQFSVVIGDEQEH